MRRLVLFAFVGVLLSPVLSTAADSDTPIPEFKESIVLLTSVRSHYADGRIIAEAIADLRKQSPTFNEMVRIIGASKVLIFITPVDNYRTENGFIGQTNLRVGKSHIVALMQVVVSREDMQLRRQAITHELAHVAEIACLGPIASQKELGQRLRLQSYRFSGGGPGQPLETRFPERVARVVLAEARGGQRGPSQLGELLVRDGLRACPEVNPGREVLIVQREETGEDFAGR